MSKDITLRINRIHSAIWRDIAKRLKLETIIKLLSLRLPKLQHGIDSLEFVFDESKLVDKGLDIIDVDILPNLKYIHLRVNIYISDMEQFNALISKLHDRTIILDSDSNTITRMFTEGIIHEVSFFTRITQLSFPNYIPTKMTTDGIPLLPPTITELTVSSLYDDKWELLPNSLTSLLFYVDIANINNINSLFLSTPPGLTKLSYRTSGSEIGNIVLPESVTDLSISTSNRKLTEITQSISILSLTICDLDKNIVQYLHSNISKLTIITNAVDIDILNSIPNIESIVIYVDCIVDYDFEPIKERYHVIISNGYVVNKHGYVIKSSKYIIKNRTIY